MSIYKPVSGQAKAIYEVLVNSKYSMTADELAKQLNVKPNTIYRAVRQLISIGIVQKSKTYPVKYKNVSPKQALPWYLLEARRTFTDTFGGTGTNTSTSGKSTLSIVKNRDDFLIKTTQDALKAQHEILIMVSGLEVPDETILTYRRVIAKGVKVRALVQQKEETSSARLQDWSEIGAAVKYIPYQGIRLYIVDDLYTYLVSYGTSNKELALGVRYDYSPLALTMRSFFEKKWIDSTELF